MNYHLFFRTLGQMDPPPIPSVPLMALWYEASGDWEQAHELVQDDISEEGAWVHAYLHRKEGDDWNARYWYKRAGQHMSIQPLDEEWKVIAASILQTIPRM